MKKDEFRQCIDDEIKPDYYLKSRLQAKVLSVKPKCRKSKPLIAGISTALCAALIITAVSFGGSGDAPAEISTSDTGVSQAQNTNFFVMSVSAAEGENIAINDSSVTIPDCKMTFDGESLHMSSETDFTVNGENIKSVKFGCETGTICVIDIAKIHYLQDNNEYYDIIVPYTDEYVHLNSNEREKLFYKHMENGDYDDYFTAVSKKDIDRYYKVDRIYDDSKGDDYIVGLGLLSKETWEQCVAYNDKEYTFINYGNETENIGNPSWLPNTDILFEKGNSKFSEIPHDTITVTVTFNDGSVQSASYDYSFNDDGNLVVEKLN